MGLRIKALRDTVVAVTGGDLQARKGSEPPAAVAVAHGSARVRPFYSGARERFAFLPCRRRRHPGCQRSWAAGRPICPRGSAASMAARCARGTSCPLKRSQMPCVSPAGASCRKRFPVYASPWRLRVVWGPQDDHFSEEGRQTFVTAAFTVSPDSDRTGTAEGASTSPGNPAWRNPSSQRVFCQAPSRFRETANPLSF